MHRAPILRKTPITEHSHSLLKSCWEFTEVLCLGNSHSSSLSSNMPSEGHMLCKAVELIMTSEGAWKWFWWTHSENICKAPHNRGEQKNIWEDQIKLSGTEKETAPCILYTHVLLYAVLAITFIRLDFYLSFICYYFVVLVNLIFQNKFIYLFYIPTAVSLPPSLLPVSSQSVSSTPLLFLLPNPFFLHVC